MGESQKTIVFHIRQTNNLFRFLIYLIIPFMLFSFFVYNSFEEILMIYGSFAPFYFSLSIGKVTQLSKKRNLILFISVLFDGVCFYLNMRISSILLVYFFYITNHGELSKLSEKYAKVYQFPFKFLILFISRIHQSEQNSNLIFLIECALFWLIFNSITLKTQHSCDNEQISPNNNLIRKTNNFFINSKNNEKFDIYQHLDNYPIGILISENKEHFLSFHYFNQTSKNILQLQSISSLSDSEVKEKLKKFELFREKNSKIIVNSKCQNLYQQLMEKAKKSEMNISRYFDGQVMILVKTLEYTDSMTGAIYKIVSVENLTEEKKELQKNLYKNIRSQFLLTISHEINNPLNGLLLYCEKLTSPSTPLSQEKKVKYLEKLRTFKFRIKFFLKNLTLSSKLILKEKIKISPTNLNLSLILNSIITKFCPFFTAKKIKYKAALKSIENVVAYYDFDYLKFFLKNILMFVCYKIGDYKNFRIEAGLIRERNVVALNFFKHNSNQVIYQYLSARRTSTKSQLENSYSDMMPIENSVQTEEMLKEIIDTLGSLMRIKVNSNFQNGPLFLTVEMEYKNLENCFMESEDVTEFSPQSCTKKSRNFSQVKREFKTDFKLNTLNTSSDVKSSVIYSLDQSKALFNVSFPIESNERRHVQFADKTKRELDDSAMIRLKKFSNVLREIEQNNQTNSKSFDFKSSDSLEVSTPAFVDKRKEVKNTNHTCNNSQNYKIRQKNVKLDCQNNLKFPSNNSKFKAAVEENSNNSEVNDNSLLFSLNNLCKINTRKSLNNLKNYCGSDKNRDKTEDTKLKTASKLESSLKKNYTSEEYYSTFQPYSMKTISNSTNLHNVFNFNIDVNVSIIEGKDNSRIETDEILLSPQEIKRKCRTHIIKPSFSQKEFVKNKTNEIVKRKRKLFSKPENKNLLKVPLTPIARSNSITCNCSRVLVVDDENFNINTMKHILKGFKIIPDSSINGLEAIEKIQRQFKKKCCGLNYKLVFMDVMMPVMDGIEASQRIEELCEMMNIHINVIIISAHEAEVIYNRISSIKVVKEFVPKPVKKSKIEELLNKYYFDI